MKIFWPESINSDIFLEKYWQKQPLLIRAGLSRIDHMLDSHELAGLALEEEIESRIITHDASTDHWTVQHGPFSENDFARLPEKDWTLLVQDVDKFAPDLSCIVDAFDFIPRWRIDDLMISYAADGGSVGPHTDSYDVFLVQLNGKRRWKINHQPCPEPVLRKDTAVKLMQDFNASHEWLLEPGDILYLPPDIPHWGIAEGEDCLTGSVGFISPVEDQLFSHWADDALEQMSQPLRYTDADLQRTKNPGEIDATALSRLLGMLKTSIEHAVDLMPVTIGKLLSSSKENLCIETADECLENIDQMLQLLKANNLYRHPALRMFYMKADNKLLFFAHGVDYSAAEITCSLVEYLCNNSFYDNDILLDLLQTSPANRELLLRLINDGLLIIENYENEN